MVTKATNLFDPQARMKHYTWVTDWLTDAIAYELHVIDEHCDLQLRLMLDAIWREPSLRRWLSAGQSATGPINEPRLLAIIGWMQERGYFADGVSKVYLAQFLLDIDPFWNTYSLETLRTAMSRRMHRSLVLTLCKLSIMQKLL